MAEGLRQSDHKPAIVGRVRRVVVKIGSAVLADERGLDPDQLERLSTEIAALHGTGLAVTVVTSGAIAAGRSILGIGVPRSIPERQATAAVGQILLMSEYQHRFARHGVTIAQILLDASDLADRRRWLNAEHAVASLHSSRILPIVNENDTTATEEITFGDNDALAAQVAVLVQARLLILLTEVDGVYTRAPGTPGAELLRDGASALEAEIGAASSLGTGGMGSKIVAAQMAASAGIPTVIAGGVGKDVLLPILQGEPRGTHFRASNDEVPPFKLWLRFGKPASGRLIVDAGARTALIEGGASLLAVGVVSVEGRFDAGDAVELVGPDGEVFAKGLAGADAQQIASRKRGLEAIHRDRLVLIG